MRATLLRPADVEDVRQLLALDVETHLFLLDQLGRFGVTDSPAQRWLGVRHGGVLEGVAMFARRPPAPGEVSPAELVVPAGSAAAAELIGRTLRRIAGCRNAVGPRDVVDAMWRGLGQPAARIWYDQRMYSCRRASDGPTLAIRPARPDETEMLVEWSARMIAEDLGEDPRSRDAGAFAAAVRGRVRQGRILVGTRDTDAPLFKLDVGTRTALGAQVGGTWVPPAHRGQGLSAAGMRACTRRLLAFHPMVTLHVNEANTPAVRCYERAGYVAGTAMRLVSAG